MKKNLRIRYWLLVPLLSLTLSNPFVEVMAEIGNLTIEVKDKRINLHAENINVKDILQELERKTGIKVEILEDIEDREISLNIKATPFLAISELLEKMSLKNFVVVYDQQLATQVIYILPKGKDIAQIVKGKTVIRPASFTNGKSINEIKGYEITTTVKGKNNVPIRYVKDEILLKFHHGVTKEEIKEILNRHNLILVDDESLSKIGYVKAWTAGREVKEVIKEIGKEYKVKVPEPNYIAGILVVTDPLYENQWYVPDLKFDRAWDMTESKNKMNIAVIDTGVNANHPDLKGRILKGYDFVNNHHDAYDDHGHGTFLAGIISATANDIGIKGLYDYAQITPVKVIDENGLGIYEDVARGIMYAADNGAEVINLSIGGYGYSFMLQEAVDYALEKGSIVVAAGGNDGIEQEIYPAAYPDVIGVSALGYDGQIWNASNSGRHIDVSAPGVDIISTGLNGDYVYASGTSASAAMVSALAAMLTSEKADLSSSFIEKLVIQTAKDLGEDGWDKIYGRGGIDALSALEQEVKPFHDVAVRDLSIEPLTFEKDKSSFIVANIQNTGTYKSEKFDATLYEIIGEEKKEIAKKEGIIVIDTMKLIFNWEPVRLNEITKFEVLIFSKDDLYSSNNVKITFKYSVNESDGLYALYKVEPPVHQWITLQAYNKLPSGPLKDEMKSYVPAYYGPKYYYYIDTFTPPSEWKTSDSSYGIASTALIEGAWEEDEEYIGSNIIDIRRSYCEHFWDPDSGYDSGFSGICVGIQYYGDYKSALEAAQTRTFQNALKNYPDDKAAAYYWLGRTAHLLEDMSVPEHVHLDPHPIFKTYEKITGEVYMLIESYFPNTDIPNIDSLAPYHLYTPSSYDNGITKLFYNLAQKTNDFDSDDVNGKSSEFGGGKFRFARNPLAKGKVVSSVEYWKPCGFFDTCKIRDMVRYVDYDIVRNNCEQRIYYYEHFYKSINNTPNLVKVRYADGTRDEFYNLDENILNDVWEEPIGCIYQPELQARATGYVAALYQLFWEKTHGALTGITNDKSTGNVIDGANVQLYGPDSSNIKGQTTTNSSGSFSFSDLEEGGYYLKIYKTGYDSTTTGTYTVSTVTTKNEWTIYLTPSTIDSDSDGLTDYEELYIYHTNPNKRDTDDDKIEDGDELAFWGDNWNADYDGDGLHNLIDPDSDGDDVNDKDDVFPADKSRWTHDITPMLQLLLLSPIADLTEIGKDKVKFDTVIYYPSTTDKTGCVGRFYFDARLMNRINSPNLSGLMVEVAELKSLKTGKRENRLILPDGSMGGIGSKFAIPRKDGYSDGILRPGEFVDVRFNICLGSWDRFNFYVNLLGIVE